MSKKPRGKGKKNSITPVRDHFFSAIRPAHHMQIKQMIILPVFILRCFINGRIASDKKLNL